MRRIPFRKSVMRVAVALAMGMSAGFPALAGPDEFETREAVSNQELDDARGGYVTAGLNLPFGLVKDLGIKDAAFVGDILYGRRDLQLVSGGSMSSADVGSALRPMIIQNSLNNQVIQHLTEINATLSSLSVLRQMNLSSMLNQQLVKSIR